MAPRSSTMAARRSATSTCAPSSRPPIRRCAAPSPQFRAAGVTEVDRRPPLQWRRAGLDRRADRRPARRATARRRDVFSYTTFRPEKSSNNETRYFQPQPQSIAPTQDRLHRHRRHRLGERAGDQRRSSPISTPTPALIGTNTYGKPVGQIALDRAACDDRLRVIAFATQNAARQGDYYDGLATTVEASCQAARRHHPSARRSARGVDARGARTSCRAQLHADPDRRRSPGGGADPEPRSGAQRSGASC